MDIPEKTGIENIAGKCPIFLNGWKILKREVDDYKLRKENSIMSELNNTFPFPGMEDSEELPDSAPGTPSAILNTLIRWGWIKSDYDEQLNTYILSFPEYSQLYVELFKKLQSGEDSREIKIQQVMLHPFPNEIRTPKNMGHSPNYILQILMRRSGK